MKRNMKRLVAYVIDYTLLTIPIMWFRLFMYDAIIAHPNIYKGIFFLIIYLWFWIPDFLFSGSSIGKKIMRLHIKPKIKNKFLFSTLHASFKIMFTCISLMAFFIYVARGNTMPYDKLLYDYYK